MANNYGRTASSSTYNQSSNLANDLSRGNSNVNSMAGNTSDPPNRIQRPGEGVRSYDQQNNSGYQNARPNDRDARNQSFQPPYMNNSSDPFDSLIDQIRQRNVLTLNQFFHPYDVYRGRHLQMWELQIIFPSVKQDVLHKICEMNQQQEALKNGEVTVQFLINRIYDTPNSNSLNLQSRPNLPETSFYIHKNVTPKIQESLIKMAEQRDISYDPNIGFEKLFQNQSGSNVITFNQLDSALRTHCNHTMEKGDVIELMMYFSHNEDTSTLNRIHFVQGIKPWVDKVRPGNPQQQHQNNNPQLQHQNSFSSTINQNGYNNAQFQQQNQYGMPQQQYPYQGQMPISQNNSSMDQQFQGQPPMGQPMVQPMAQPMAHQIAQPMAQPNSYQQQQYGQPQMTPSSQMPPQQTSQYPSQQQIPNQFPKEDQVFQQIYQQFGSDFEQITAALRQRKTGLFKHFSQHCQNGVALTQEEFNRSIDLLGLVQIPSNSRYLIFTQLSGISGGFQVQIATFEALFKFVAGQKAPKVSKDSVLQNILQAFNLDIPFIQLGLSRKGTQIESFVEFFEQFTGYQQYFTVEQIQIVAESYLFHNGNVNHQVFISDLNRIQSSINLQRRNDFEGIQKDNRVSQGPSNPLMPNFAQDCTKAATLGRSEPPYHFIPPIDDLPIEEIIKGCFVINKLVEDCFISFQNKGVLNKIDFTAAMSSLRTSLQISQSEKFFDEIDKVMTNNRPVGQVTASTVDQYVHFSCKTSLTKLHEAIMSKVVERVSVRNVNIQAQFQMNDSRGQSTIPLTAFIQILKEIDPSLRDNDLPFVAKKYTNGIDFMYVKFMDDFNQASRVYLADNKRALPEFIAEQLKKKLYLLKSDLSQYLKRTIRAQYISQQEFSDIFGQSLELVPQICQPSALINIFTQLSRNGTATVDEVVRFFELKCSRDHHSLKDDLIKQLRQHGQNIRQVMEKEREVIQYGNLSISTFEAILLRDFKISALDANFVADFYIKSGSIDIQIFLADVSGAQNGANNVKLSELLAAIKNAADSRKVQLAQEFGRHQTGRSYSIAKDAFFNEISRFFQLSFPDQLLIEQNYASPQNSREIDHIKFLEDIKGSVKDNKPKSIVYTQEQLRAISEAKRVLQAEEEVRKTLVRSFTYQDQTNRGYLSQAKMQLAFKEAANVKFRQGTLTFKMTEQQERLLISCCETDSLGDYNYNQLLDELIGRSQVQQILNTNAQTASTSPVNNQIGQASSTRLGDIAKRLFPKQKLVEEQIVKMSKQKVNGIPLISEQDFGAILLQSGVNLSVDERQDLQNLFSKTRDGQGLNNPVAIFKELGLVPVILTQGTAKAAPKPKVLSDQDLRACQDLINEVCKDIKSQGRRPEQMVQNVNGTSIGPADFMKTLKSETTEAVRVKLTNQSVGNLMHYLYRDETGRVNLKKLLQALSLPESEPPLKQDGIEDHLKYMGQLNAQINNTTVPFPIYELNQFMRNKDNMSLGQMLQLQQNAMSSDMLVTTFEEKLQEQGFIPKEKVELLKCIQTPETGKNKVSIQTLQKFLKQLAPKFVDQKGVKEKYGRMNTVVRKNISQISQYMQRNGITVEQMHKQLDINNDGSVDKMEFVDGFTSLMKPCPITNKDLGDIFDQIDINGDHYLSVNELALFLEGAQLTKKEKINKMDPRLIQDIERSITDLFKQLDIRSTGFITHVEIFTTMKGLKQPITEEKAKEMIKKVDIDGDGRITLSELITLLKPILLEELLSKDDSTEQLRAMFKEADTDYSGFLSIDEMYACMLQMGVSCSRQEIVKLFMEFDINGDMQIDIDEFIAIMSFGDDIQLQDQENVSTYLKIKQARKINVLDFAKIFNTLPQSFVPSFYTDQWSNQKKNLPSSGLKAQIDPKTMGWKDMLPLLTEQMTAEYQTRGIKYMRPIPTTLGCQIVIESAEGVPLPAESKDFDRQNIIKRVVRVGLFDTVKQELIFNSAQVVARWEAGSEDIWTTQPSEQSSSLNPILLRTTKQDDLNKTKVVLVFELVVYVKNGNKTTEMSCGWSQLELNQCERDLTKFKLDIKGGTPMNQIRIDDGDVHTKRSGVQGFLKMFNSNIKSTLIVSIQPMAKIDDATKTHMEFLPSTCVVSKKLVSFVSGYRNYAAELLIRGNLGGSLKKPAGDVIMATFPKIMDCPDVLEILSLCWTEDFMDKQNTVSKQSVELAVTKVKDYVQRLYPIFYAEDFGYQLSNITESACGDMPKMAARTTLITSALRYNNKDAKKAAAKPPQTNYKPFNIREIEFEIWEDGHVQKQEGFMRRFDQAGVVSAPTI